MGAPKKTRETPLPLKEPMTSADLSPEVTQEMGADLPGVQPAGNYAEISINDDMSPQGETGHDRATNLVLTMLENAEAGKYRYLNSENKRRVLKKFLTVLEGANQDDLPALKFNLQGKFLEAVDKTLNPLNKTQAKWVSGSPELPIHDLDPKKGVSFAQPDQTKQVAGHAVFINQKLFNFDEETTIEQGRKAAYAARKQAIKNVFGNLNQRGSMGHLPDDAQIVISSALAPSKEVQSEMVRILFDENSPITEVRFGDTVYKRPNPVVNPKTVTPNQSPKKQAEPRKPASKKVILEAREDPSRVDTLEAKYRRVSLNRLTTLAGINPETDEELPSVKVDPNARRIWEEYSLLTLQDLRARELAGDKLAGKFLDRSLRDHDDKTMKAFGRGKKEKAAKPAPVLTGSLETGWHVEPPGAEKEKQASEQKVAPKKAAPKPAAPKKQAPKKAAPKSAEPKKPAPKKAAPKPAAPKKQAPKKAAPKKPAPMPAAPKKPAPKPAAPEQAEPKINVPKKEVPKTAAPKITAKQVTHGLNTVDSVLSAPLEFQRYRDEYLRQGLSETEANSLAAARAGITLGANLKGGPLATIVNAANTFENAKNSGQGNTEALATTAGSVAGGLISNQIAPTGPAGAAVQLLNTTTHLLGAPQPVQDTTAIAAELVPSSIISTTVTQGARSMANIVTGDTKALERQADQMARGQAGTWLQGYAELAGIASDVASGDDLQKALEKAAKLGEGSVANRIGEGLADQMFELSQNEDAKAGKYGPQVQQLAQALDILGKISAGSDVGDAFGKVYKNEIEQAKKLWRAVVGD
jgi:hypothetical protein